MNFKIKVTGLKEAISTLKTFKRTLHDKMKEVVEKLMQEGYEIASVAFTEALYAGENDVTVEMSWSDNETLEIRANGNSVAFIEFGSGVTQEPYPTDFPGADPYSELGLSQRGEYGKHLGSKPPWYYIGEPGNIGEPIEPWGIKTSGKYAGNYIIKTEGNPPARGLYNAAMTVTDRNKVLEVAKEVFK